MNKPDETQKPTVPDHVGIKPDGTPYDKRSNAEIIGEALGWEPPRQPETQRHECNECHGLGLHTPSCSLKTGPYISSPVLPTEGPPHQPAGPEWQPIFDEVGYDIIDIVMDFQHGRKSAGETMDRISDFALAAYRTRADLTHADAIKVIEAKRDEWQRSKKDVSWDNGGSGHDAVCEKIDLQVAAASELIALLKENESSK